MEQEVNATQMEAFYWGGSAEFLYNLRDFCIGIFMGMFVQLLNITTNRQQFVALINKKYGHQPSKSCFGQT